MLRTIQKAALLVAVPAALAIGVAAAPANAGDVGIQATGTFRDVLLEETGPVDDSEECVIIPDDSVTMQLTSGSVQLYADDSCDVELGVPVIAPGIYPVVAGLSYASVS